MKNIYLTLTCMVALLMGCSSEPKPVAKQRVETKIVAHTYTLSANDLDMQTILDALKNDPSVSDAENLEKFINTTAGVNNVDTDRDGVIDNIVVRESKGESGQVVLALTAVNTASEETVAAELNFTRTETGSVTVAASHPDYVEGHQHHYYSHTMHHSHMAQMAFMAWLFMPRPMYYHPIGFYAHRPYYGMHRPVLGGAALRTTRTQTHTTRSVSPVARSKRPASYKPSTKSAQKKSSKFAKKPASTGKLKGTAKGAKNFAARNPKKSKPKATGFGAKKSKPKSNWSKPKPQSGWGSKPSRSSGWGGGGFRRSSGGRRR